MKTLFRTALAAAATLLLASASHAGSAGAELSRMPKAKLLPSGVVQLSPFIPGMGEHWANPKSLPFGPIYCVSGGRIVCMEYMVSQQDFASGKSFEKLMPWFAGAPQPAIHHMEFNFNPKGHAGYEVPHYDVHMFFVSPETLKAPQQSASN